MRISAFWASCLAYLCLSTPALASVTITPDQLDNWVQRYTYETLQSYQFSSLEVCPLRFPQVTITFPEAKTVHDITVEPNSPLSKRYSNRSVVRLTLTGPSGLVRRIGIPVRLKGVKPVWVARQSIRPGEVLSPRNIQLKEQVITQALERILDAETKPYGNEARLFISKGCILDSNKVQSKLAVHMGQTVTAVLRDSHGMSLSVKAKALQDGSVGQSIRIEQLGFNKKVYQATIQRPGLVVAAL